MVRVSQRNKSPIEFIDLARKIADIVNDRMAHLLDKISKKYPKYKYIALKVYNYYYEKPIQLSIDAYLCVSYGNRIRIKDKATYERRTKQFKFAIEHYNKLTSVLSVLFGKMRGSINYNALSN